MILQALCEYYKRKEKDLPAFGFEEKAIPFIIVIDKDGKFINLQHNVITEDKKQITEPSRVPKTKGRTGTKSYEVANILWDHYGYIVAQPKLNKPDAEPTEKDIAIANNQHNSFKRLVEEILIDIPNDKGVQAVNAFLHSNDDKEKLKSHELWKECIKKPGTNLSFKLAGETYWVCQSPQVIEWVKNQEDTNGDEKQGTCLITGKKTEISRLHDAIKNVAQNPAPLASINGKAYNSYGKDKGFNFPVGRESVFQYTTAINDLLRKNSPTKFRIGATSYMCWSEKENTLVSAFTSLFIDNPDDPDKHAREIKSLFNSIHNGAYTNIEGTTHFYVLGLTPTNKSRVAVSYWKKGTVKEFAENIAQWFDDLLIIGQDYYGFPVVKKLLLSITPDIKNSITGYQNNNKKDKKIPDKYKADLIRAILDNSNLPEPMYLHSLRRLHFLIKANSKIEKWTKDEQLYLLTSFIKASINRKLRNQHKRLLKMSLDKSNKNEGYCLGRLFAVLERAQKDAQGEINTTIRDRYYSSASTTPKLVFGRLMSLYTHHLKKMKEVSWKIKTEKRVGNIYNLIKEFPTHLNLENQGLFAIGYYHQKQYLFKKSDKTGEEE